MGFSVFAHPEIEFYLLRQPVDINHLEPVDQAGYFDHVTRGLSNDFRRKIVHALEDTGIQVEFSHHEAGPGQNEVDLRAVDALRAADNIMTAKTLIEEVALSEGMLATFMPKPFADQQGSGMHTHLSLFEGDENAFYDPSGRYQLSEIGRYFIAGLLHHAREIAAITNQHVNSYKRLWGGGEAPSFICWGHNNRSALVRVPAYKPKTMSGSSVIPSDRFWEFTRCLRLFLMLCVRCANQNLLLKLWVSRFLSTFCVKKRVSGANTVVRLPPGNCGNSLRSMDDL